MAKPKRRKLPEGVVLILGRRFSGAAGRHTGRTDRPRGTQKRESIRSSRESQ